VNKRRAVQKGAKKKKKAVKTGKRT